MGFAVAITKAFLDVERALKVVAYDGTYTSRVVYNKLSFWLFWHFLFALNLLFVHICC